MLTDLTDYSRDEEWYAALARLRITHPDELSLELISELVEIYPDEKGWINYSYRYLCAYPYSKNPLDAQSYLDNLTFVEFISENDASGTNSTEENDHLSPSGKSREHHLLSYQQYRYGDLSFETTINNLETADNSQTYLETYPLEILQKLLDWFGHCGDIDDIFFRDTIKEFTNSETFQKEICSALVLLTEPFADIPFGETIRRHALQLKGELAAPIFY